MVDVRLLGVVELRAADRSLDLGPPKQRAVFAALAVDAGRPVRVDTLVDRVWGDAPPSEARNALYAHVMRIRRLLVRAAGAEGDGPRLDRRRGGYVFDIDRDQVDLHRFQRLVDQARDGGHDDSRRVLLLREALGLWRDAPAADLDGEWFARLREGCRQHWLNAMVNWARVELRLGNHDAVIGPLHEATVHHPFVEPLAEVMMRALHAAGRGAEALDHYALTRQRLVHQLGAEPGPALRQLHQVILRGETEPAPTDRTVRGRSDGQVPRQLPAPPAMFTGRTRELAELGRIHDASTVAIAVIDGMAGVGKTALAVHLAHMIADRYPDGQLFIDLHGHTQGMAPREPGEALDQLLRALGVPGAQIPSGLEERAGLYRTRLADRRTLVVLDNAAADAQVAPLLPAAPGCLVLITSRHRLTGLDHTCTLSLDTLPTADGVMLFAQTAGADRLHSQPPELLVELVELCGRLPLAIRIAAARLRSRPAWSVSHLVRRLRDQQNRLAELEAGQRSVTAALDLSYQHLNVEQQRGYRLLGVHPGPDVDPYAAAALLDSTVRQAGRIVDELLDVHLLQEPVANRYRFHDLTRAHARHAATRDQASYRRAALHRLLDHYRQTARTAMAAAYPYECERRPQVPPAGTPSPDVSDSALALEWLDRELPNVLAAASSAAEHGRADYVPHMSSILHHHLRARGHYEDAIALHRQALSAARVTGHPADELEALAGLGRIHRLWGRYPEASDHYRQALRVARAAGHQPGELDALNGLGHIDRLQGRHTRASDRYRQVLRIARATGDSSAELVALNGLGHIDRLQGRHATAIGHYEQAQRIARATGHRPGELEARLGLGHIHLLQGRHTQATDMYEHVLRIARASGDRQTELAALNGLGPTDRLLGRYAQASARYHQLLALARETGNRNMQFEAWQGLGRLRQATGEPDAAVTHHDEALTLAKELGQPLDQARAHDGLAHAYHRLNRHQEARTHWQQALDLLTDLGVDDTYDEDANSVAIRANIAGLRSRSSYLPASSN